MINVRKMQYVYERISWVAAESSPYIKYPTIPILAKDYFRYYAS